MIIGAVISAIFWIISVIIAVISLKPWERIYPSGILLMLVFFEVIGIVAGYIISNVWSYFNG